MTERLNGWEVEDFDLGVAVAIDAALIAALGSEFRKRISDSPYPDSRCTRFRDVSPSRDTTRTGQVAFHSFEGFRRHTITL